METRTQLSEIRQRRGISAASLARLAGIASQTIYPIEAGDYVPNTTLALELARLLEVRVEDLFRLEGEPAPVYLSARPSAHSGSEPDSICGWPSQGH